MEQFDFAATRGIAGRRQALLDGSPSAIGAGQTDSGVFEASGGYSEIHAWCPVRKEVAGWMGEREHSPLPRCGQPFDCSLATSIALQTVRKGEIQTALDCRVRQRTLAARNTLWDVAIKKVGMRNPKMP